MLYREAGQFKTSYQTDAAIFPIRQDRIAIALFAIEYTLIVSYEEGVLESIFGQEYLDYKKATPRWIPRPPGDAEAGPHDWGEAWKSETSTFMQYIALAVVFGIKQRLA